MGRGGGEGGEGWGEGRGVSGGGGGGGGGNGGGFSGLFLVKYSYNHMFSCFPFLRLIPDTTTEGRMRWSPVLH